MTPRERIRAAIEHREPDQLAVDFGSSFITGIHCSVVAQLRDHFNLEPRRVKVCEPYQMLGEVEPDLLDAMGLDVEPIFPQRTIFGFPNENWKPWTTPWGQEVLVSEHFNTRTDNKGNTYIFPKGNMDAPASGLMPETGFFFDTIERVAPDFDEDNLDLEHNLEEFGLMGGEEAGYWKMQAEACRDSDRAVSVHLNGTCLGDIALQNMQKLKDLAGDVIDVVVVCGTDFGTQTSLFCSVDKVREVWMPRYRKINDWIHRNTRWKTFKHSCGAVASLVETFIDSGFDILNPVQCSAAGMGPRLLKEQYGDRITFWGGGVNTQQTLPFGTPEEVRAEVLERCRIFAPGGGFVFNAIHNIQARTPIANVIAMIKAVREFNGDV